MSLKTNLEQETVASLPLRTAIQVSPQTLLRNVVAQLRSAELGCAIVVDSEGKPVGSFTERSLLPMLLAGVDLDREIVSRHLDPKFAIVHEDAPIATLLKRILDDELRFLCVVDKAGKVKGLTGQRGLAEYVSEHFPRQVMVQRLGSQQALKEREGA